MSSWFLLIVIAILTATFFLKKYFRFLYLVFKLPGPSFMVSVIGLANLVTKRKGIYSIALELVSAYPSVFRIFLGPYVQIITSRPQDVEAIANECLDKGLLYDIFKELMDNSTLVAEVKDWQMKRKLLNNSFNVKLVRSFVDVFAKQGKNLAKKLEGENKDLMVTVWACTFGASFETLTNTVADDELIEDSIHIVKRGEEIYVKRVFNPWLNFKTIWNKSRFCEELTSLNNRGDSNLGKIISAAKDKHELVSTNSRKKLLFLNNLLTGVEKGLVSKDYIFTETKVMLTASSETTACAVTFALIALGMYPEIQDLVYKEVISTLGESEELTFEKSKQLQYLDRVIKETMRLKPPVPIIGRKLHKEIFSEPFVFPAGVDVLFFIDKLHKNPEIWKDPLKFDPDRFLPEEVEKRHRWSYIPFSHGVRNCIGYKYAMLSMKCMIAEVVRNFRIKTSHPKELVDLEIKFALVSEPHNYSIEFIKRQ